MKAQCTLTQSPGDIWRVHHAGSTLGDVEVTGRTRDEALAKMQRELQYRLELCPCSGQSLGTVELQVNSVGNSEQ
mgnify:FL=1